MDARVQLAAQEADGWATLTARRRQDRNGSIRACSTEYDEKVHAAVKGHGGSGCAPVGTSRVMLIRPFSPRGL